MNLLNLEQFKELKKATENRTAEPQAFTEALERLGALPAWGKLETSRIRATQAVISGVLMAREEKVPRAVARGIKDGGYNIVGNDTEFTRSPILALTLGEIGRIAKEGAPVATAPKAIDARTKLGEDQRMIDWFAALTPLIGVLGTYRSNHIPRRQRWGAPIAAIAKDCEKLPLSMVWETTENFYAINEQIGDSKVVRATVPASGLSNWGGLMSGAAFLGDQDFPDALEQAYKAHWHTKPTRKHPGGVFVQHLRERIIAKGSPELLIVLAASSDGANRAVAGLGENTPPKVYEKLIYDNSLNVLSSVVRNKQFDNYKAYAMMETNLPPQIVAVMLHGKVDISVKVLAARRAIAHDQVDPLHIYRFLFERRADSEVPHALWRDFVRATNSRLIRLRQGGAPEAIEAYEKRLDRVRQQFVTDLLKPYVAAVKALEEAEKKVDDPREHAFYRNQRLNWVNTNQRFVAANQFIRDPELFDILVEGAKIGDDLTDLLAMHKEAKLPISKKLLVKILQHPDRKAREKAIAMMPSLAEADVQKLAQELEEQIQKDYADIKDQVLTTVIPDYEKIEGEPRKVSRMRYNFEAAKVLTQEVLIEAFTRAAEKDPRTIPDEFRRLTEAYLAKTSPSHKGQVEVEEDGGVLKHQKIKLKKGQNI